MWGGDPGGRGRAPSQHCWAPPRGQVSRVLASPALPAARPKGPADHRGTGEARSRRPAAGRPGQGWGHSGCSLGHTSTRPPSPAECHSSAAWHASPPRGARSPPLQGHNSLHLGAPAPRPSPCPLPTRPQSPGPWLPTQPAVVKVPQPPGQAARRLHSQPPPTPPSPGLPEFRGTPEPRPGPSGLSPAWHRRPVYPARQRQEKPVPRPSQVPPFAQGLRKQGEGAERAQGVTVTHHCPS